MVKMKNQRRFRVIWLIVVVLTIAICDAQAYLDPGTGSYAFQILIAGFTTFLFTASSIKRKVSSLFTPTKTFKDRKRLDHSAIK
jgi:hypothetical protein